MTGSGQNINVEEIMEEIRRDIKEKGYQNDDISFSDVPLSGKYLTMDNSNLAAQKIMLLQARYNVFAYRPLASNRSFGALIVFIKKVIRKMIKFYIEPIVSDQNDVNGLVASGLKDLYLDMEAMERRIRQLEEECQRLKNKVSES